MAFNYHLGSAGRKTRKLHDMIGLWNRSYRKIVVELDRFDWPLEVDANGFVEPDDDIAPALRCRYCRLREYVLACNLIPILGAGSEGGRPNQSAAEPGEKQVFLNKIPRANSPKLSSPDK
ncbi:hypothetical protein [Bradyrhizobium sp. 27S5]|uniref:hypothetical protein n=1 Tax=Bradyrhizobium sp. 27S5 TaxID=3139728 RepID=UPI0030CBDC9D